MGRLASILVALALLAGCGGATGGAGFDAGELASSADVTAQAGGARFDLTVQQQVPGAAQPVTITASGVMDPGGRRALMTMDLSSIADQLGTGADLGDGRIEMIVDGLVTYLKASFIPSEVLAGKEWVRIDAAALAGRAGISADDLSSLGQNDPLRLLDWLRGASGEVKLVGSEKIDGETTSHYHARLDLRRTLDGLPPRLRKAAKPGIDQLIEAAGPTMPADVWVDGSGRVRRFATSLTIRPQGSKEALTTLYRLDLSDYGREPVIEVPAKGRTVDLLDVLQSPAAGS